MYNEHTKLIKQIIRTLHNLQKLLHDYRVRVVSDVVSAAMQFVKVDFRL